MRIHAARMTGFAALFLAAAATLPARSGEPGAEPVFLTTTADGTTARGPLRELKADGSARVGDGEGTRVAAGDLISLRRDGKALPPPAERCLVLANGDRVPCVDPPRLDGERVRFRSPGLFGDREADVPLAAVSLVFRAPPESADEPERFLRRLLAGPRKRDAVHLRNGDVLEGLLLSLDARQAEVEVGRKTSSATAAQVAAVVFSSEGADATRPKRPYYRAVVATPAGDLAAWLSLASASCADGATLEAATPFGARLRVPLARVLALDVCQGKAVSLSDLKPARVETAGFGGEKGSLWPPVVDGSVDGRDLRLGGSVYPRGLGLHPYTRITYALGGRYRRFEALVGLDDATGRKGSAVVRVFADGKPLEAVPMGELTHGGSPVAVRASVAGAKELTLEVDFGATAGVQAHVNWADARLVK